MQFLLLVLAIVLQQPETEHTNTKDGLAVGGYDVVAYFSGEAEKGSKSIRASHQGITYRFSSESNKQKFLDSPKKYVPAYGGWCAYAMGVSGDKVKIDPETFKVIDDKLYLFYNFWGNNTLKSWNEDESGLKTKADKYWSETLSSNK
ncbi:MAG: YHS domain-containing (seleno)protein [Cytophagales bacterium]|nr:YHS domain-containing (seleno)protein [Cytophagales bacterium]